MELLATAKHICFTLMLLVFYLFSAKRSEDYSRIILYLFTLYYFVLSYWTRVLWRKHLWKKHGDQEGRSILVLTEEGIEESGTHEELLEKKGIYESLYHMHGLR